MGSCRILKQPGRLNLISHSTTLNALERRALKYSWRSLSQNQQDKALAHQAAVPGTQLAEAPVSNTVSQLTEEQVFSNAILQNSALLVRIGTIPRSNPDHTTRLLYENVMDIMP